jgi:hypothetical protein
MFCTSKRFVRDLIHYAYRDMIMPGSAPLTHDEIVDRYIRGYRVIARAEMRSFAKEESLAAAIRRAALSRWPNGKKHEHQYLVPPAVLQESEERLQAAAKRLARAPDFTALHRIVAGAAVLGFKGKTLRPEKLPPAFSRLTAAEIEDCLCIYRRELAGTPWTCPWKLFPPHCRSESPACLYAAADCSGESLPVWQNIHCAA